MIDTALSLWGAISWTWVGAAILCGVAGALLIYLGQIQAGVFLIATGICLGAVGTIITQRDLARTELAAKLEELTEATAALEKATGERDGWIKVAAEQNAAVEATRKAGDARLARAVQQALEARAEAERYRANAESLRALAAAPQADESCQAADVEIVKRLAMQ